MNAQFGQPGEFGPHLSAVDGDERTEEENIGPLRLNVRLAPKVRKALDWIVAVAGVTHVEAVRRAIGTEKFFQEVRQNGGEVFVKMPGQSQLKQVVFYD